MATFKETLVIFPENNVPPARRVTLKDLVICGTSEFFGTAVLLFLSCTGATLDIQGDATVLHVSMAAGLAVTVVIQMLGHISGAYVNPVVTLSAYILGEINLKQTLLYVVCQISGCLCGTGFHRLLTPAGVLSGGERGVCVNTPGRGISDLEAFGVEIILTIILVIANCSSWDKRNSHKSDSVPIKIGLVVVALNVSAAAYTGASMNPARSFGPAVWSSDYKSHWIYWTAPTIGSLLASYAYKYVFLERNE
ncbi:aquaporin AQPcic isoform X1 [Diabrotica virgifera virgifera]|uniref:Aquaporin AQPcic-like isoform X1 n=1 Tax=Diabrotica virgifera virgifera TaxID=50390 RepID=A0A6P7FNR0_DIAVI|nr:aquaporin AQPcic isoform X1 [Diabrotica virgifera virgifera]